MNVRSTAHEFIAALAENEKVKIVTTPHLYDLIPTFETFVVDVGVIVDFVNLLFSELIWSLNTLPCTASSADPAVVAVRLLTMVFFVAPSAMPFSFVTCVVVMRPAAEVVALPMADLMVAMLALNQFSTLPRIVFDSPST